MHTYTKSLKKLFRARLMGTNKILPWQTFQWMACKLTFMMDGRRTDGHDGAHWMVCDVQWRSHNRVEGIVG